jgi:hypothetical protein
MLHQTKNGAVVREYAGYDRLEGLEEQTLLAAVYKLLVPLPNFFILSQKRSNKTRVGSKEIKACGERQSPFQRLIKCAELPHIYKNTLKAQHALYNPVELPRNVNKAVLCLCQRPAQLNRIKTREQE